MSETLLLKILLFEGVAFFLLAAVCVCRQFFRQPVDRIRLTQIGFALVAIAAIGVGCGVGVIRLDIFSTEPITEPIIEAGSATTWSDRMPVVTITQDVVVTEPRERALRSNDPPPSPRPYPLMTQTDKVAYRSPNGSVGDSRLEAGNGDSTSTPVTSAEYRTLLPSAALATTSVSGHFAALRSRLLLLLAIALFLPSLILFLRDFSAYRRLRLLLNNSADVPPNVAKLFQQIRGNSRKKVRLRMSEEVATPMVFGWLRLTLLLPVRFCVGAKDFLPLRACLMHEWSHLRNGDLVTWNLVRLFQYPLWMQPFYWMLRHQLLVDQDYLADDAGVQTCGAPADYAQILLNFAKLRSVAKSCGLGMAGREKSQLRRRITMLLAETRPTRTANKRRLLLPIILLTTLTLLGSALRLDETTAQTQRELATVSPSENNATVSPSGEISNNEWDENAVPGSLPITNETNLAVELTGHDGTPANGGHIRAYLDPRPADWGNSWAKNFDIVDGKCHIPLMPPEALKSFSMIIYADGFAPFEAAWQDLKGDPVPTTFAVQLLPAETVGGIVVDEQDYPIEGVQVEFIVEWGGQNRHNLRVGSVCGIRMQTDAEGRWTSSNVRREELNVRKRIEFNHPNYARVETADMLRSFLADSEGNFTQKTVLRQGATFTGTVADEQGNPMENVLVFSNLINQSINNPDTTRTDAKGEFKFENCVAEPNAQLYVGVCKDGFAPDLISFARITPSVNPVAFMLKPGNTVKIRVVDTQGNGIEDVRISPANWRGIRGHIIRFFDTERGDVRTDHEGRFVWHNAPADEFLLSVGKSGYMSGRDVSVTLGDQENVFTLRPHMIVDGKVFDAETKEPIPTLMVMYGIGFAGEDQKIFWNATRNQGQLTQTPEGFRWMQRQPVEDFDRWLLRVDVEGYETCVSEPLQANTDHQILEFALQKKKPDAENPDLIIGTILIPDGEPAEGVQVGFATTQRRAQVDNGQINFDADFTVRTDASGVFRLSRLNSSINDQDYKLIFLHETGFAAIRKAEFEQRKEPISLQAWGRIEGTIYTGKHPAKEAWATISYNPDDDRSWDRPYISYFYRVPCDENGRFVFNRVFPGKGRVGQSITINNGGSWPFSHLQRYEINSGETLTVTIGGGGYAVAGQISLPSEEELKTVDWRFASVAATLTVPERVAVRHPRLFELMQYLQNAPELNAGWFPDPDDREKVIRRWEESPEGQKIIAEKPELYEETKQALAIAIDHDRQRIRSWNSQVTTTVDERGRFQLSDLTPGDWTLKVTLSWPKVPGQFWDLADVWEKEMSISVKDLPNSPPDEPIGIGPIFLGDPTDRKGARRQ